MSFDSILSTQKLDIIIPFGKLNEQVLVVVLLKKNKRIDS